MIQCFISNHNSCSSILNFWILFCKFPPYCFACSLSETPLNCIHCFIASWFPCPFSFIFFCSFICYLLIEPHSYHPFILATIFQKLIFCVSFFIASSPSFIVAINYLTALMIIMFSVILFPLARHRVSMLSKIFPLLFWFVFPVRGFLKYVLTTGCIYWRVIP